MPKPLKAFLGRLLTAIVAGTILAFLISLFQPFLDWSIKLFTPYLRLNRPHYAIVQAFLILLSLLLLGLLAKFPQKLWHSLRLGLIPFQQWVWASSVMIFWVMLEFHQARVAWGIVGVTILLTAGYNLIQRRAATVEPKQLGHLDSDLPIPEDGEDLVGRRPIINDLISDIVLEKPEVIAITGAYGEGKT